MVSRTLRTGGHSRADWGGPFDDLPVAGGLYGKRLRQLPVWTFHRSNGQTKAGPAAPPGGANRGRPASLRFHHGPLERWSGSRVDRARISSEVAPGLCQHSIETTGF